MGTLNKGREGYGTAHSNIGRMGVHRFALYLSVGDAPYSGAHACHKCDVPCCVNPGHLFWGTAKENSMDCVRKGRAKPYVPPLGDYPRAKLSISNVKDIRSDARSSREIAVAYGVSLSAIKAVKSRKTWSFVA
jgi:hypothetical protein